MNFSGTTELHTEEISGELRFHLVRQAGWAERVMIPVILAITAWYAWRYHSWFYAAAAAIGTVSVCVHYLQGNETTLVLNEHELVARGNLSIFFRTEIRIPLDDIRYLHYSFGGESDPGGLYAKQEWSDTCVLPFLNQEQTTAVIEAIHRRYPQIPIKGDAGSFLYGDDSGLVTLGLNRREPHGNDLPRP